MVSTQNTSLPQHGMHSTMSATRVTSASKGQHKLAPRWAPESITIRVMHLGEAISHACTQDKDVECIRTGQVGSKERHLGSPAQQLLDHALCAARHRQHRAAFALCHVHAARARPRPERLGMLQQLRHPTPSHITNFCYPLILATLYKCEGVRSCPQHIQTHNLVAPVVALDLIACAFCEACLLWHAPNLEYISSEERIPLSPKCQYTELPQWAVRAAHESRADINGPDHPA